MKTRQSMFASAYMAVAAASTMMATAANSATVVDACGKERPRGADVEAIAAICRIGKLYQTRKLGCYNTVCNELSEHERCLAVLKQKVERSSGFDGISSDDLALRLGYCLQVVLPGLLQVLDNEPIDGQS